jgi:hypothetical protein
VTDTPLRDENGNLVAIVGVSRDGSAATDGGSGTSAVVAAASRLAFWRDGARPAAEPAPATVDAARPGWREALPRQLVGFAWGTALFAGAVVARILLDQVIPERLPFISFFPAALLAPLLCGRSASIALLLAAAAAGAYWGDPPDGGSDLPFRILSGSLFIVTGGPMMALVFHLLSLQDRLKRQDAQLSLINRELKHRLKNLLTVASSICAQTVKSGFRAKSLPRRSPAEFTPWRWRGTFSASRRRRAPISARWSMPSSSPCRRTLPACTSRALPRRCRPKRRRRSPSSCTSSPPTP